MLRIFFYEKIREVYFGMSVGVKDSGKTPGHMGVSGVVSVRGTGSGKKVVNIFLLKKLMKSLLLQVKGIEWTATLCFFLRQEIVLKRKLGCFLFL